MRRLKTFAVIVPVLATFTLAGTFTASALAGDRAVGLKATLSGYSEVPALSTTGAGTFTATSNSPFTSISYELSYTGMSSAVSAAHIHLAQAGVNGGVVAFLCGGGGKPACPADGEVVAGTITAEDILALPAQGIEAGELEEVLMAIARGVTYVNAHSATYPGGEIRGQITRA